MLYTMVVPIARMLTGTTRITKIYSIDISFGLFPSSRNDWPPEFHETILRQYLVISLKAKEIKICSP